MTESEVQWLQKYVDARIAGIDQRMQDQEAKRIEMLTVLRDAGDEFKRTLSEKLGEMNHLQRRMDNERGFNVTKEQLDAVMGKIETRIFAIGALAMAAVQVIVHVFLRN